MTLKNLVDGLKRAPWRDVGRHIVGRAGYDTSRGYENTATLVMAAHADQDKISRLAAGLVEHLVAGEKHVQFIRIQPSERVVVKRWIDAKRMHSNELTGASPGVAPEAKIIPYRLQDPTSVGSAEIEVGSAALYTAVRAYMHSAPIAPSQLKASAGDGYERIVGFRNVYVQTYDAIWLPPKGDFVALCVDYPAVGPTQTFPQESAAYLAQQLRSLLGRPIKRANFWHAVDGLYDAPDGKLVDYGFSAGGQSVNHHKARRKSSTCLRKAVYDEGGAAAIKSAGGFLELFKVAMQWSRKHQDGIVVDPEVLLHGKAIDLNKAQPVIDHCVIRDCLTTSDLEFVISKLTPHITQWV